jgi:hypothetical protein
MDVVKRGVLIGSMEKLGSGLGGVLARKKMNGSSTLPTIITRVVGTPQMVFTNSIMTTHVNRTTNQPPMSSMATGRYKSIDATNPRGGYRKPSAIITQFFYHKDGPYVRPNKIALKYPNFKKDVNLNVHVRMFNFVVKANANTSKIYIINEFNYTLKDTISDWCHNYMLEFPNCIFSKLTHAFCKPHRKTHNDK